MHRPRPSLIDIRQYALQSLSISFVSMMVPVTRLVLDGSWELRYIDICTRSAVETGSEVKGGGGRRGFQVLLPVLWFFGFVFGVINASISLIKTQNTIFTNVQSRIQSEYSICFVLSFLLFSLCFFGAETSPVLLGIFVIGRRIVLLTATNPWLFRPLQYSTVQCSLPPPRICCAS